MTCSHVFPIAQLIMNMPLLTGLGKDNANDSSFSNCGSLGHKSWKAPLSHFALLSRYFLDDTQHNTEQYLTSQTISASESVREMAAAAAAAPVA